MDYTLAIENAPDEIPGGTGVLLLHPSIGETDRIDTDFLKTDTDHFLVISTRTTAREVKQKLDHYGVIAEDGSDGPESAVILDTLSIERGYSRRSTDDVFYAASPDDLDSILEITEQFLTDHDGKLRLSVDSITEMIYYSDEDRVFEAMEKLLALLEEHDAVGLFHLSEGVHDDEDVERFKRLFDGVVYLDDEERVSAEF